MQRGGALNQSLVVDVVYGGAEEIAAALLPPSAGRQAGVEKSVTKRLDAALLQISAAAGGEDVLTSRSARPRTVREAMAAAQAPISPKSSLPTSNPALLWSAMGALALGSVGALIISKVLVGVLLGLGPVFVVLALFETTRGLFEGWLRALLSYGLIPVFVLVLSAAVLAVVEPLTEQLAVQSGNGLANPAGLLAMVSIVFLIVVGLAARLSLQLTASWSLPRGSADMQEAPESPLSQTAAPMTNANERISNLVSTIERQALPPLQLAVTGQRPDVSTALPRFDAEAPKTAFSFDRRRPGRSARVLARGARSSGRGA